ncbi:MAG: protein translocase subunit SecF [Rhodospirillales bacterium]|mgnify:CR=1 FL=1|nr:protein translocase subunit SecF [Rhodospirillales bacterium]MDG4601170.1 protein translocase subunit SecF [Defluviicoccus sp.]MDG4609733.1 protein translocase subunit SecF [Defluviicoccus sp.]HOT82402.1 protein translocase subunit SecF [Candidatus Defluviicoccus seviourii]
MFRGIRFFPETPRLPFMAWRRLYLIVSSILIIGSLTAFVVRGFNFGIDFAGGILLEVRMPGPADLGSMRQTLGGLDLGDVSLQEFGSADTVLIRVPKQDGSEEAQQRAVSAVKEALGSAVQYRRVEFVGPQVGSELLRDALYAVAAALLAIMVYIWFRFEWQFGVCGLISLIHDVIVTAGIFSALGYEFNLTIVAAIMTIAGYSINDTVVVFDRVRENMRKYKAMAMPELIDLSVNQTLSRTILTSGTTLLTVVSLYILGGEVLRGFSFAMIWGILTGTYSSICVAVPILIWFNVRHSTLAGDSTAQEAEQQQP